MSEQQLTHSQEEEEDYIEDEEEVLSQEEASMDSDSEVDESTEVSPIVDKKKLYTKDYRLHEIRISTVDRYCKIVEPPESHILSNEEFYNPDGFPNIDLIKEHLRKEGRIQLTHLMKLIHDVHDLFCAEDNVLMVEAPLTVCGDIHGQYYDLLKLFEVGGDPKTTQYLFLGDYVDRGYFSIECLILLFCYKLVFPNNFWLIRGNHECRHLTDYFTFKEECEYKYDTSVYEAVMDTFDALPLAAIMNKQFYCVHGGLSPQIQSIEQLNNIDRFTEPPSSGPMCDLLWADPMEDFSGDDMFEFNAVRGCSFNFGYGAVCKFLEQNKLLSVIRAHEAQDAGYRMYRRNEKSGFPSVITLFSAPNYLGTYNNKGAVLRYENNVINIRQFNHSPHPYYLPGFMNVFAWSLPFVGDKLVEIILTILKLVDDSEAEKVEAVTEAEAADKRRVLHSKIRGVTKMLAILHKMRKVRAEQLSAGLLSPNDIKPSILQVTFETAKELDRPNEARPSSPRSGDLRSSGSTDLRSSTDGLQRRISRDNILFAKKNSVERINLAQLLKDAPIVPPQIKEEKIPQVPPPQIKEEVIPEINQNPV